jgi:hypothetical protein
MTTVEPYKLDLGAAIVTQVLEHKLDALLLVLTRVPTSGCRPGEI